MRDKNGKELNSSQIFRKSINRGMAIFDDFFLMLIRWSGLIPSHHARRFIYRLSGMKIGKGSSIHMWSNFYSLKNIAIGEDTIIGDHVFLDGRDRLTIGNHVAIASYVLIYNSEHDVDHEEFAPVLEPVIIEDYVFIGPGSILLPGVMIGKGAVVAAGAVVTKNVEPFTVVGGVPAKVIKKRRVQNPAYKLGRARWFQ